MDLNQTGISFDFVDCSSDKLVVYVVGVVFGDCEGDCGWLLEKFLWFGDRGVGRRLRDC
jgi:hypothetical protein